MAFNVRWLIHYKPSTIYYILSRDIRIYSLLMHGVYSMEGSPSGFHTIIPSQQEQLKNQFSMNAKQLIR